MAADGLDEVDVLLNDIRAGTARKGVTAAWWWRRSGIGVITVEEESHHGVQVVVTEVLQIGPEGAGTRIEGTVSRLGMPCLSSGLNMGWVNSDWGWPTLMNVKNSDWSEWALGSDWC